jgi:uncharacterized protein YjbI with pentapeptide repeats
MELPKNKKIFVPIDSKGNPWLILSVPVSKKVPSRKDFLSELKNFLGKQIKKVKKIDAGYLMVPKINEYIDYADQATKILDWNSQTLTPIKFQNFIREYFKKLSPFEFLNRFPLGRYSNRKIVNPSLESDRSYQKFMLMNYSGKKKFGRYLENVFREQTLGFNWLVGHKLDTLNLNSIKVSDYDFSKGKLTNLNFNCSDIENFIFNNASLSKVSFHKAKLKNCKFESVVFRKAHFLDSEVIGANFNKAKMEGSHFQYARIIMGNFIKANINDGDFRYSVAVECDFEGSKLKGANFQEAILSGSNFEKANLENANFCGAKLSGVVLKGARLSNAIIDYRTKLPDGIDKKTMEKFKVLPAPPVF